MYKKFKKLIQKIVFRVIYKESIKFLGCDLLIKIKKVHVNVSENENALL